MWLTGSFNSRQFIPLNVRINGNGRLYLNPIKPVKNMLAATVDVQLADEIIKFIQQNNSKR